MSSVWSIVLVSETVLLLAVLISQARLRIRMRQFGERTSTTTAQMREVVQEAQSLSVALAARLAEPMAGGARIDMDGVSRERTSGIARDDESRAARPMVPAAWVPLVARGMAAAEDPEADRAAARAAGMDPVGVAIQRRLMARDTRLA